VWADEVQVRVAHVAVLVRGDRTVDPAAVRASRLGPVFDALEDLSLTCDAIVYSEGTSAVVRDQILGFDGVLVWVDPVTGSDDRSNLDALLRDVASSGVWVSAHPEVILKMGTKEVLYRTRELSWGSDTYLYSGVEDFKQSFPRRLAAGGARVLKQYRGNGGIGVEKVELISAPASADAVVRVQYARTRDEETEDIPLTAFMQRCEHYFAYSGGRLIDQPFQARISEGMIRCYLVKGEVVGFARQYPTQPSATGNAADPSAARRVFGLPSHKTMYPPNDPTLRALRTKLESEWVPSMQTLVDVDTDALPALWDADFLLGPRDDSGNDTYVLCEINVSAVLPFPAEAPAKLALAVRAAVDARNRRSSAVRRTV
jgi:glutathione synthase/RimK-type ligase-like ATP-grasp enzyme